MSVSNTSSKSGLSSQSAPTRAGRKESRISATAWQRACYRLVTRQLVDLKQGELKIRSLMGEQVFGEPSDVSVELLVHDMETFERLMSGGSVGAGEAYMEGQWDCDDLVALVRLLVRNRELLDGMEGGFAAIGGALLKLWHEFRRNTRKGSRDNIAAHYDLGNDLFELFLDRDWMMYSSALYNSPDETLEQAQFNN